MEIEVDIIQCRVLFNLAVVWAGIEIDLVLGCGSKFRLVFVQVVELDYYTRYAFVCRSKLI